MDNLLLKVLSIQLPPRTLSPKESFESGLEKTILWYINNVDWWKSILDNTYNQARLGILQS